MSSSAARSRKDYDAVGLCAQSKVAARGDAGVRFVGSRRVGARGEWRGTCRSCLSGNDALRRVCPARDEGPPLSLCAHRTIRRRNAPSRARRRRRADPSPRSLSRVRRRSSTHAPVATVRSGDVVHLWTVSGEPGAIPSTRTTSPASCRTSGSRSAALATAPSPASIPREVLRRLGPHVMTGPIAVLGARPGDILRVVLSAEPWTDWGWNAIRPGASARARRAPESCHAPGPHRRRPHTPRATHVLPSVGGRGRRNLTRRHRHGSVLRPDGRRARPESGRAVERPPGPHGGNLDNKRLGPGSSVYFRVNVPGAGFSAGDGHAIQGDGEFCVTALETLLRVDFDSPSSEPTTPTRTRGTTSSRGARGTEPIRARRLRRTISRWRFTRTWTWRRSWCFWIC